MYESCAPLTLGSRIAASTIASCRAVPAASSAGTGSAFQSVVAVGEGTGDGVAVAMATGVADAVGVDDGSSARGDAGPHAAADATRIAAHAATSTRVIAIANGAAGAALCRGRTPTARGR